ncbi:MAG: tetratricopeptide repeat protein [Cytophagaceae bacterium]
MKLLHYSFLFSFLILLGCGSRVYDDRIPVIQTSNPLEPQLMVLSEAIEDDPRNDKLYHRRAQLLFEHNQPEKALTDINQAIFFENNEAQYYFLLAKIYNRLGKTNLSLNAGEKALGMENNNPEILIFLSELYWELKDLSKAEKFLSQASAISPQNQELNVMKARLTLLKGDSTAAVSSLRTQALSENASPESYKELVKIYHKRRNTDSAMYYLIRGRSLSQNEAFYPFYESEIFRQMNLKESSELALNKALAVDSLYSPALFRLGTDHYIDNKPEKAIVYFEKVSQDPVYVKDANLYLGRSYEKLGDLERALSFYKRVLTIDSSNVHAGVAVDNIYKQNPGFRPEAIADSIKQSQIPNFRNLPDAGKDEKQKEPVLKPKAPEEKPKVTEQKPKTPVSPAPKKIQKDTTEKPGPVTADTASKN